MFIGTAKRGPIDSPIRCTSYTEFARNFGEDPAGGELVRYVKLFFLNGGTDCYVMRIANGAGQAAITLNNELGTPALTLTAKDAGALGNNLRAVVTYAGAQPEATFNLELFRWEIDSAGRRVKKDTEVWQNLSMDPAAPTYAPLFLTQNSRLLDASTSLGLPPTPAFSVSGRFLAPAVLLGLLNAPNNKNKFQISVDGSRYVDVVVDPTGVTAATLAAAFKSAIDTALLSQTPAPSVTASLPQGPGTVSRIQISSNGNGDVLIRPSTTADDLAVPMMLGTAQGGIEVSRYSPNRPAPTGISTEIALAKLNAFADVKLSTAAVNKIVLDALDGTGAVVQEQIPLDVVIPTLPINSKVFVDANNNSDGVREKLAMIAQQINSFTPPDPSHKFSWRAEVWGSRLGIQPGDIFADNHRMTNFDAQTAPDFKSLFQTPNVHLYSVGLGGPNQSGPLSGNDGAAPIASDYDKAYLKIDKEVDLFNLMVLPPDAAVPITSVYGKASVFCQQRRAFLLMDPPEPPSSWTNAQQASTGVAALRIGLVKDYSAIFFPKITIDDNGLKKNIGPAGAIAGLCARTDGTRGVWKAPAGTDADLRGVIGLEQKFSDGENGILNPRAVNTIRIFPNGIVNWGARTMDGDDGFASEYKYIPIRRLALYMEESLYRGLKWVVFEPNDEPLYAQIRLNVGAFMHNLFRQGAFQGQTPKDAYFVKCDKETTTQNDRNLGIVNIWVGFAPLKPAEFVILYLQQMAGQIEV
jgi:hypothetical protein